MPELTLELRAAAESDDVEAIDVLIKAGADPNAKNLAGNTALHAAAYRGSVGAIRALLAAGADRNARNVYGATALDIAMREGRDDAARAMHEAHDDIDRRRDRSRESTAVPSSAVRQNQGTGRHRRTRRPGIRRMRRPRTSTGECAAR